MNVAQFGLSDSVFQIRQVILACGKSRWANSKDMQKGLFPRQVKIAIRKSAKCHHLPDGFLQAMQLPRRWLREWCSSVKRAIAPDFLLCVFLFRLRWENSHDSPKLNVALATTK